MNGVFVWNGSTSKGYVIINGRTDNFTVIDPTLAGFLSDIVLYEPSLGNSKVMEGTTWRALTSTEVTAISTYLTNYVMPALSYCADATTLRYVGQVPLAAGLIAVSGPPADSSMIWDTTTNTWVLPPVVAAPINYQQLAMQAVTPYMKPDIVPVLTAIAAVLNDTNVNSALSTYNSVGTLLNPTTVVNKIQMASTSSLQSFVALLTSTTTPLTVADVAALVSTL